MALQTIVEVVDRMVLAQPGGATFGRKPEGAAVAAVETARGHDFAPGAAAPVEIPRPIELVDDLVITAVARALEHHLPIPLETICLKGLEDQGRSPRHLPRRIDIFDAYQPASLLRSGLQKAAEGGDQRTEVKRA